LWWGVDLKKLASSRRKLLSAAVAFALALSSVDVALANQPTDSAAPWLSKLTVSAASITDAQSKTISYKANLSDDRYVQGGTCQLRKGAKTSALVAFKKVSGSNLGGTWECKIAFPKKSSVGDWRLELSLADASGNRRSLKALTHGTFEQWQVNSQSTPEIRSISGGIFKVTDSRQKKAEQSFSHPFSLIGEFGVGGYAQVWPQSLPNKSVSVKWFADGQSITAETGTRLNLGAGLVGKTLSAQLQITASGFRPKIVDILGKYPVGSAIADGNSSAGWIYPDGTQRSLSRPFCFEPQASSSLGTARIGWKVETWCPYTSSSTFGFPTGKKIYWFSNGLPQEITSQSNYRLRATDANRELIMVYEQVWANGYWTAGVEKFASPIQATLASSRPTLVGSVTVGKSISVNLGAWQKGAQFNYQWFRDYVPIAGSTAKTYLVSAADLGKPISVMVKGVLTGYSPSTRVSLPVSSGIVTAPDIQSIYNDAIASYVPSQNRTVTDIHVSPTVDPVSLSVNEALMQKAADFWSNQFDGTDVRVIFVTPADSQGTWIDELFAANPTWGSAGTIRQKIASSGCGWAYANAGSVVQCVPGSDTFDDNYRQVMPHEYTHLVQFGWDSYIGSQTMPWMVEGMANFYGLALGVSSQAGAVQTINKSLAGHATQWDTFNGHPFASFKMLSIISADAEDSRLFFRKGADLWTNYMIGSLFSEWSIKTIGHARYSEFVRDLLRARTERNDLEKTNVITQRYFGLTLDDLSFAVAPYFEQRAIQLQNSWPKNQ
jgi:hypothetical protein